MPKLPSGYTAVEYIESDGTQYIDTGVRPQWDDRIEVDMQPLSEDVAAFFGSRDEDTVTDSNSFAVWMINGEYRVDYGDDKKMVSTGSPLGRVAIALDGRNKSYSIGGASGTLDSSIDSSQNSILLFTTINRAGDGPDTRMMRGRLYSCTIYSWNPYYYVFNIQRYFTPCVRDSGNVPGLYEWRSSTFYRSETGQDFIAGPETGAGTTPIIRSASFSKNPVNMNTSTTLTVEAVEVYKGEGDIVRPATDIEPLTPERYELAGASVGNYALFAGGASRDHRKIYDTVDAYNTSLTHSTPTALSVARNNLAGASVGSYALFAGGGDANDPYDTVDAYNTSLTRSTPTALSKGQYYLAGASVGSYALFAGGFASNTVNAYNRSLTRSTPTALSSGRYQLAGASVGSYALFAGGTENGDEELENVDAYNTALTRTTPTELSLGRLALAGASTGSYALFAGGCDNANRDTATLAVDAYNASLTRSTPMWLKTPRYYLAGTSIDGYAIFAGGYDSTRVDTYDDMVDVYNAALTRTNPAPLSAGRSGLAAASVGDYAVFACGQDGPVVGTVDVYADINDL